VSRTNPDGSVTQGTFNWDIKSTGYIYIVNSTSILPSGKYSAYAIVTFADGSSLLGVASISSSGIASFSVNTLWAGSHNITATYSGDANYF
jgi:hypothetical protein